jgi:hypothetical protein
MVDQPEEIGGLLCLNIICGMAVLTCSQCPVCKADVTLPWHLSQANKPHAAPANEQSSASDAISPSVVTPPVTELTPLLHDRGGS